MSTKTALVMRASGRQGTGAVRHLAKAGWKVHAFVKDATNDRALALQSLGSQVTLYEGTWNNLPTLEKAMAGCQALFFNQLPASDDAEMQEARVVLDLAAEAKIQHVVFTSSLPLSFPDIRERLNDSAASTSVLGKADVEEAVKACGMTWTMLRPGYILTNLLPPLIYYIHPEIKENKIINSYGPECNLAVVDPDDIGALVAGALDDATKFGSQTIMAVSEIVRFDLLVKELGNAIGTPIQAVYRTPEETEEAKHERVVAGQLICIGMEKLVDMGEVRSWGVPLTSLKQFLEKHKQEFRSIASTQRAV
jgi:uncharacterized protein YbjT (DUF2867 family)